MMTVPFRTFAVLAALLIMRGALAQEPARQDHESLRQAIGQFLRTQAAGLPGKTSVTVGAVDPRLNLPACTVPEPFLPPGGRAWGKTTVGVRCAAPSPWTIYVSATVRVQGEYVATAAPLAQGKSISPTDLVRMKGDLTNLPPGIVTDPVQAIGRSLSMSLPAGAPVRQDALRSPQAIQQGQTVRVVTSGPGFRVSAEGRALNNVSEGQMAQVRTPNGQLVSGIARMGGIVEVTY